MMENRAGHALMGLNVFYFALAAVATVYVVAEAWHYGFWLSPFPCLLTLLSITFIGATILGTACLTKGVARCLLLCGFVQMLALAATGGTYFAPQSSVNEMLGIMFTIVGVEAFVLLQASHQGISRFPTARFSPTALAAVRNLALLAPLPIFAFAGLQFVVQEMHCDSAGNMAATMGYMKCERLIFGCKRADKMFCKFVGLEMQHANFPAAETYARLAIENAEHPPLFYDRTKAKCRLADRHELLSDVFLTAGKCNQSSQEMRQSRTIFSHSSR